MNYDQASINYRGNDEFAYLIGSFNSMIETIKSDIQNQTELSSQLKLYKFSIDKNDMIKFNDFLLAPVFIVLQSIFHLHG